MNHIYVIAGNFHQAKNYIAQKRQEALTAEIPPLLQDSHLYVNDVTSLRGIVKPHGVFIGTWKERYDIHDILHTLCMCWQGENHQLNAMFKGLQPRVKPTPKKPTADQAISAAADLLAKEMDEEVLRQAMGKVPPLNPIFDILMKDPSVWKILPKKP